MSSLLEENMEDMQKGLLNTLMMYSHEKKQIDEFNEVFFRILQNSYNNIAHVGKLFYDHDIKDSNGHIRKAGVLNYPLFTLLIDRTGIGTQIFSKKRNKFIAIPSKEYILLAIVAFDMYEDKDEILNAAGYKGYVKNLNEFIISVGMNNFKTLSEIRKKLIEYGFRGEKATDYELHYEPDKRDCNRKFNLILTKYLKGNKQTEKVANDSGLISLKYDPSKNSYYYNAFTGANNKPFKLTNEQALRLFTAMDLNLDEKREFSLELISNKFIYEDEEEELLVLVEEGNTGLIKTPTRDKSSKVDVNDVSVYTRSIESVISTIDWEDIDDFISKTFGSIRSFAVFFQDIMDSEDTSIPELKRRFGVPDSQLYHYVKGIGLPSFARLSVLVTMFPSMTQFKYLQLVKKAGAFEFGENSETPLMMIVNTLLESTSDEVLFGKLFDTFEWLIENDQEIPALFVDISEAYIYQCSIIASFFLGKGTRVDIGEELLEIMKKLKKMKVKDLTTLSLIIIEKSPVMTIDQYRTLQEVLLDNFAFDRDSALLVAIEEIMQKEMED
jgi:hypothetical protein